MTEKELIYKYYEKELITITKSHNINENSLGLSIIALNNFKYFPNYIKETYSNNIELEDGIWCHLSLSDGYLFLTQVKNINKMDRKYQDFKLIYSGCIYDNCNCVYNKAETITYSSFSNKEISLLWHFHYFKPNFLLLPRTSLEIIDL